MLLVCNEYPLVERCVYSEALFNVLQKTCDVLDNRDSAIAVRDALKCLLYGMMHSWCDAVPRYMAGDVSQPEIRHYAQGWGILQSLLPVLASTLIPDTPSGIPDVDRSAKYGMSLFREAFQKLSCPTDPTGNAYFILAPHSLSVKIGYTGNSCAQRLMQLQTGTPEPLILLGYMAADERYTELFLHEKFRAQRIRGEWFKFDSSIVDFISWGCEKRAPSTTLESIPEFEESKWNCDPWPKHLPQTNKEIEAWLSTPAIYK